MRLYITGCVGSGKSTLARELSRVTGVECFHLDEVMYEPAPDEPSGNRKRDPAERDRIFEDIIARDNWIIEDAGRACFSHGIEAADALVVLRLPRLTTYRRVIRRWLRQRLGREKAIYRPTLHMLKSMLQWVREYDPAQFGSYADKSVYLTTPREISAYINSAGSRNF